MMADFALEVKNLCAGYEGVPVLHGISFEVKEGEIVAIVGANGAGKTTTLRTIAGLLRPTDGFVKFMARMSRGSPLI